MPREAKPKPITPAAMARLPLAELRRLPIADRLRLDPKRCPNLAKHTPCPDGYLQFANWADEKSITHKQIRCPGCGRYSIWVPHPKEES